MSSTLPQTTKNREVAEKVTALLAQATTLGVETRLLTRRQARKALQGRGQLRTALISKGAWA